MSGVTYYTADEARHAPRYVSDEAACGAESPADPTDGDAGWRCTLVAGHPGDHVAHGIRSAICRWGGDEG